MRKFLLTLAVLCGTVSGWAGPTDLPEMSTEGNIKWYTIKNTRSTSGSYLYWAGDNVGLKDSNTKTSRSLFYFTGTADACYIHNSMNDKLFNNQSSWTKEGVLCSISETPHESKAGVAIGFSNTYLNEQNTADGYTTWGANDAGSIFVLEAVTLEEVKEIAEADKTSFLKILNAAPSVFNTAGIKAEIEAIEISGIESAQALYAAMDKMYLDRFFTFQTLATDNHRNGVYIGVYDSNPVYASGVTGVSFNEMWSFKPAYTGYDKFVLYNDIYDKYIGTPGQDANTDLLSNTGSIYTIEIIDDANNTVEFKCNGRTLHASNHNDDKLLNWDGNEAASRWKITEVNLESFIQEEIDNCGNNYAETPELGQYSKEAYDLLVASKTTANTPSKVKAAIATFKKSKNVPVYFIRSAWNEGYSNGSAIYFDGAWKWKTANIYDRQMWMTIPNYAQANVPSVDVYDANGTSYEICDYLTGNLMRGKKVQIVNVAGWVGAMNLQYSTNTNDAVHHAQSGGALVGWNPAAITENGTKDCSASAWHVEYIGTSYELGQLSEEYFNAAAELAAFSIHDFEYGTGVNSYSDANKPALDAAIANRTNVLSKLSTADEIAAAKAQLEEAIAGLEINLPENGKFYRVRCAGSGMKYLQSTLDNSNENDIRLQVVSSATSVEATFCYNDGTLVSYTTGKSINAYRYNEVGTTSNVVFSKASNGKLGRYNINVGGRYIFGANDNNKIDSGTTRDNRDGYTWWLEVVTTLPVTITSAEYATFYAPCNVTLPEGLTAYYVLNTGNGYATLKAIEGNVVPANTGVLLHGAEGQYNLAIGGEATEVESKLSGTVASEYISTPSYVLSKQDGVVGFYKALMNQEENTSFLNNGFKAYLPAGESNARALVFDFGTETGIDELKGENENVKTAVYDLAGRRIQNAKKGIFIVNGVKVIN